MLILARFLNTHILIDKVSTLFFCERFFLGEEEGFEIIPLHHTHHNHHIYPLTQFVFDLKSYET